MSDSTTAPSLPELYRLLCNLLRVGLVEQVDHGNALVRVRVGALVTDWVRWFEHRAGTVRNWSAPSEGEQVMLLSPGGDLNAAVALRGIYSETAPAPAASGSVHVTQYADGAVISYDDASGQLLASGVTSASVQASGSVTLDAPHTTVTGQLLVQGLLTYQAGMAGTGGAGGTTITGPITQSGGALSSNGVVLHTHMHPGDSGGTTGVPQ